MIGATFESMTSTVTLRHGRETSHEELLLLLLLGLCREGTVLGATQRRSLANASYVYRRSADVWMGRAQPTPVTVTRRLTTVVLVMVMMSVRVLVNPRTSTIVFVAVE